MPPTKRLALPRPRPAVKQMAKDFQITSDLEQPPALNYPNYTPLVQQARRNPQNLTASDVLQLQRTIGNQAVGRLLAKTPKTSSTQSVNNLPNTKVNSSREEEGQPKLSRAIQRIVGFEFETSWHLDRTNTKAKELERNQVVAEVPGSWKLTAEEVPGKDYTVGEFKTQAVSEMDIEAQKLVFDNFRPSVKNLAQIDKPTPLKDLGFATTGGFEDVQISPNKELRAQPQVTGGIRLDRILDFMKETANTKSGLRARSYVADTAKSAEKTLSDAPPEIAGVIALLAAYIQGAGQAQKKVDYPKGAISILSRMNIPELLQEVAPELSPGILEKSVGDVIGKPVDGIITKLEEIYKVHLKSENNDKAAYIEAIEKAFAGQEELLGDKYKNLLDTSKADWTYKSEGAKKIKDMKKRFDKVEPPMFSKAARENDKIPNISSSRWLQDLEKGIDSIDWAFGTAPQNQKGKSFGIEMVGEKDAHRGVPLEVRSLDSVDWQEWEPLAMKLFETVRRINSDEKPEKGKINKLTRRDSNSELSLPKSLQEGKSEVKPPLKRVNSMENLSKVLVNFLPPRGDKKPEKDLKKSQ